MAEKKPTNIIAGFLAVLTLAVATPVLVWAQSMQAGPYLIQADTLHWDKSTRTIRAQGNVLLSSAQGLITAQTVHLDLASNMVHASGGVTWDSSDSRGHARMVSMHTETRVGQFYDAVIYNAAGTRLWGERIEQTGPGEYEIYKGGFTPCACPEQAGEPAWQITVREARVSWRESVRFRHGAFWGNRAPFFYLPTGYIPLLEARQSGLLVPRLSYSRRYGFITRPGVFATLGDHADVTFWGDYRTLGGWGFETEARARSASGSYRASVDWFKEADDAPFLADENRSASKRWVFQAGIREQPRDWFRLSSDVRLLSDTRLDADFADDLDDLTRANSRSNLVVSRELDKIGAAALRFETNQALVGTRASGSRTPSLRLLSNPITLGRLPFWGEAGLQYDFFSAYNPNRGDPWDPTTYDRQAQRTLLRAGVGGRLDPVPGLLLKGRMGLVSIWRDRTLHSEISTLPYQTTSRTVAVTTSTVAVAEAGVEYGLLFATPGASAMLRPGLDVSWSRPTNPGGYAIDDLDSPQWQTWLVPRLFADGHLGQNWFWQYALRYPVRYAVSPDPLGIWSHDATLGIDYVQLHARLWHRDVDARLPRTDTWLSIHPTDNHTIIAGFGRNTTDYTAQTWDLGRGGGLADDVLAIEPYREMYLSYRWQIWRFFGDVTGRRRFPQYDRHPSAWIERSATFGYRDPCECLRVSVGWRDFPGTRADRVDFRLDLALLGGIATEP